MLSIDALNYHGLSFVEWASKLNSLERSILPGEDFKISILSIHLQQEFLRRLRCLNLADFEKAERPNTTFRTTVVYPLLNPDERNNYRPSDTLYTFLLRAWKLTDVDADAASDIFVTLRNLLRKQSGQTTNKRFHQAFDFVQLFYDIYSIEFSDVLFESREPFEVQFSGLFERYLKEDNDWVRFALGYVLVDFCGDRKLTLERATRIEIDRVFADYSVLLTKWTGRRWDYSAT